MRNQVRRLEDWWDGLPSMLGDYREPLTRLATAGILAVALRWYWRVLFGLFVSTHLSRAGSMRLVAAAGFWALSHLLSMFFPGLFGLAVAYVVVREVWRRGSEVTIVIPPGLDMSEETASCRKTPFVDCGTFDLMVRRLTPPPTTVTARAKDLRFLGTVAAMAWWSLLLRLWSGSFQSFHFAVPTASPEVIMEIGLTFALALVVATTLMRVAKALMDLFTIWTTPWIGRVDELVGRLVRRGFGDAPSRSRHQGRFWRRQLDD